MMKTQSENETEEDYYDDPIRLFDFELERVHSGTQSIRYFTGQSIGTGDNVYNQLKDFRICSEVAKSSDTEHNDFRKYDYPPTSVKLVDCMKFPWYFKKYTKQILSKSNIYVIDDDSSDSEGTVIIEVDQSNEEIDVDDCFIIDKEVNEAPRKRDDSKKLQEHLLIKRALSQRNKTKVDFKRNKGLIGMTVTPKFLLNVMPQVDIYKTNNIADKKTYNGKHVNVSKITSCKERYSNVGTKYELYSENINIGNLKGTIEGKQINNDKNITNRPNKSPDEYNYSNKNSRSDISHSSRDCNTKLSNSSNKNKKSLNKINSSKKTTSKHFNVKELFKELVLVIDKKKTNQVIDKSLKANSNREHIPYKEAENKLQTPLNDYYYNTFSKATNSNEFQPNTNEGKNPPILSNEVKNCNQIVDRSYANHENIKSVSTDYVTASDLTRNDNITLVHKNCNEKNIKNNLSSDNNRSAASSYTVVHDNIAADFENSSIETVVVQGTASINLYNDNQCTTHKQTISTPVSFCNQVNNFNDCIKTNSSTTNPTMQTLDHNKTHTETNIDLTINKTNTRNPFATAIILRPNQLQTYSNKYSLNHLTGNSEKSLRKALQCQPRLLQNHQQTHQHRMANFDNQFTPLLYENKCFLQDKPIIKIRPIDIRLLHKNNACESIMTEQPSKEILANSQFHPSQSNLKSAKDSQRKSIPHSANINRENYSMVNKDTGIQIAQSVNNGSVSGICANKQILEAKMELCNKKGKGEMLQLVVSPTLQNIITSQNNNFGHDSTCKTNQDSPTTSSQQSSTDIANKTNARSGISERKISTLNVTRETRKDMVPNNLKRRSHYTEETKIIQPPFTELNKRKSNLDDHITQIWQNCGYSPPILPIPTYENILDQINSEFKTMGGIKNKILTNYHERFEIYKQRKYNQSGIKKITLDEYKKRVFNSNSDVGGKL